MKKKFLTGEIFREQMCSFRFRGLLRLKSTKIHDFRIKLVGILGVDYNYDRRSFWSNTVIDD